MLKLGNTNSNVFNVDVHTTNTCGQLASTVISVNVLLYAIVSIFK